MKIYIGADHNGFMLKAQLIAGLARGGHEVIDQGDATLNPDDDFPQFAERVVRAMQADGAKDVRGILVCGSGQGMCMAANRFKGIRASLVWDEAEARAARNDDDSNVLCLAAREMAEPTAIALAELWLATPFAGAPRFTRRIKQLDQLG